MDEGPSEYDDRKNNFDSQDSIENKENDVESSYKSGEDRWNDQYLE